MQEAVQELVSAVAAAAMRTVAAGAGSTYGLSDLLDADAWASALREGRGVHVIAGALRGALPVLRDRGITPLDIVAAEPLAMPGNITRDDFALARRWLIYGLIEQENATELPHDVAVALAARGWIRNPIRITSTALAILTLAKRARATRRRLG